MNEKSMRDLLTSPVWQASDVGLPIPDSPHATSVAMPMWEHVVAYEEGNEEFRKQLACGYPRFVFHPRVIELFEACRKRFAREGEICFAFSSEKVARGCAAYLRECGLGDARVHPLEDSGIHAVVLPENGFDHAKKYWQHFGSIVSSRRAVAALEERGPIGGEGADALLRERIAGLAGAAPDDVFLYPTGMAAMSGALALAQARRPGARSIQLGFPYVDGLKIQTVRGPGCHFLCGREAEDLQRIAELVAAEPISGVFCELPSNPLLRSAHLPRLAEILRGAQVPLIVDDTIATFANVDAFPYVDMLASSLTKHFSGAGDVMAGSLVLNRQSWAYEELARLQADQYENLLWPEDAAALENNSRDFPQRMLRINETTLRLVEWLQGQPAVAHIHYPTTETREAYDAVRRPGGGYGGLFSLVLKNGETAAPRVFNALRMSKGPSLGTNFSLACPYTLLAHFDELEWAASLGIAPHLIRISIGLEEFEDLRERFEQALRVH